ncbi:MAG: precorrin-6A/cobalt-precorrin-6A reductase [Synechococcus sp.]
MHRAELHRPAAAGPRLWLVAGTGEGPPLAQALLDRGWRLRVSVVGAAAARAYRSDPALEIRVGALEREALTAELAQSRAAGDPFHWVVDATHPFARRISALLEQVCRRQRQPLLRLRRPPLAEPGVDPAPVLLGQIGDLAACGPWAGRRLLLAIGSRQLPAACAASAGALHFARVLPAPDSLALVLAAGLAPERIACLRPGGEGSVERALCLRWGITTVLCRQSGGRTETLWRSLCRQLALPLLLLAAPPEPGAPAVFSPRELLARIGGPGPLPPAWEAPAALR